MVAKVGSPRSSLSLPLHCEHFLQLGFSSPLCSAKNEILIGRGLDANHIGSKLFQLQCQVLQKYSALKESSTGPIETGFGPNKKSVEISDLITEKQTPNATPLRKRPGRKRVPEGSLIGPKEKNERDYTLNGSVQFIDKYEHLKVVQLVEGISISGAAYAKCLERASYTTDAKINSVITILSRVGLNKDEIGLVFSKRPSMLKRDAVQLMKVFHLLLGLGCREEQLRGFCIQYPALLERDPDQIRKVIVFLQSVGLTKEEVLSVLHKRPRVLSYPEDRVKLSVNCLLEIGVPKEDLYRILKKVPALFLPAIQKNLQIHLEFLVRIGLEPRALGKAIARRPNMLGFDLEGMTLSYKYLLRVGVQPEDVGKVVLWKPQLLGYRITTLEAKIKYLRELGVKDEALGKVITRAPQYFSCSLEKRIKPRYEQLARRGIHVSLSSMLKCNDQDFQSRYLHRNNHRPSANQNEE